MLTGGTGYIGSHAAISLLEAGHEIVLFDNLCNSKISVCKSIEGIAKKSARFIEGDVRNQDFVFKALKDNHIEAVMHFAGLKSVAESVQNPILYYDNNVCGSISLLAAMRKARIKKLIFSSSATVYGSPVYLPYDELHPTAPMNPYGQTKLQVEQILADLAQSDYEWQIGSLRYFNPIGAHPSGLIGENPNDLPNNLMPFICRVVSGELPELKIFGNDYGTKDGTGERDYIHVMDLAEGHVAMLDFLTANKGYSTINLGTGNSTSVLELVSAFERASGKAIPRKYVGRRPGDLSAYYAKAELAKSKLNWSAKRSIDDMCTSAWNYLRQQMIKTS